MEIDRLKGRQILDSRGEPTVECDVWLASGAFGRAAVPSGASTGEHEAHELRDGEAAFGGKGVLKAVGNIDGEIAKSIKGLRADDQHLIDRKLIEIDGTPDKARLGANAILAVSLAAARAAADGRQLLLYQHLNDIASNPAMSLPLPMMNVLNGGRHASGSSDFQEFMIIPKSAESYTKAVRIGAEIFLALKQNIAKSGLPTAVGDEGGFTYPIKANTDMLDLLNSASTAAGYHPGDTHGYGVDVAASELFQDERYTLEKEGRRLTADEMIDYLATMSQKYPVISIEDGLAEDEWSSWSQMTERLGGLQLVGDDLFVTNAERLQRGIDTNAANAILIKPNQIGTLTETIEAIQLAKKHGWRTTISHRSGETEDVFIAHLAVGLGAGQIKTGSLSRGERTAKHNELIRLEEIDGSLRLARPFD